MEPTSENITAPIIGLIILFIGLLLISKFVRDHFDNQL